MDDAVRSFIEHNHSAAMVTLKADGTPHVARIGVAVVDGKVWSSGTQSRLRTKFLRRDPRSTLMVFDAAFKYLGLECTVTILDGPDAPDLNLKLFTVMQAGQTPAAPEGKLMWYGQPKTPDEFRQAMVAEGRLVYEFAINRAYGLYR